jgi:TonB family protein
VRSVPPFDDAALVAVRQWEYEVTRVDGQPVPVQLTIPITFALRLPEITREPGVPELRQGVAPAFPAGPTSRGPVRARAELTIDSEGHVREAAITGGDPPYTEALLQAVRTWAFLPPGGGATMEVEATFDAEAKDAQRVQLRIYGLKKTAAVSPTPTPAPAPSPAAPTAPAPTASARPDVPRPVSAPAPATASAVPAPVRSPAPAASPSAAAPPPRASDPASAAVEVVPGPAPTPTPRPTDTASMTAGVSAVRDVALSEGVPDLTSGRRPQVPPLARMEGVSGQVEVRFVVEASGATSNVEVAGPDRLKEAARQTVSSWTFRRGSTERLFLVVTIDYGGDAARAVVKRQTT